MGSDNSRSRRHPPPRRRSGSAEQRDKRTRGDVRTSDRRDCADRGRSISYRADSPSFERSSRKRNRDQVSQVPAKRYRSRSMDREKEYEYSNR